MSKINLGRCEFDDPHFRPLKLEENIDSVVAEHIKIVVTCFEELGIDKKLIAKALKKYKSRINRNT